MKRNFMIISVFMILSAAVVANTQSGSKEVCDLTSSQTGRFPTSWRTWPFQRSKARDVYHVEQENDTKFIRASDDQDHSVQIMKDFDWRIEDYPYLSWKWRARTLPTNAREDNDDKNDSACGVYVIIGRAMNGQALKYVWSTSLPVGNVVTRRDGKLKIKVTQSGATHLNQWQKQTVQVPSDYKALFGDDLKKNPSGIALLTDGNATHTAASCDYADFRISKNP